MTWPHTFGRGVIAAALLLASGYGHTAEPGSRTYQFDDWTVTVTPGVSATPRRAAVPVASTVEVVPANFETAAVSAPIDAADVPDMPPSPVGVATTADVEYLPSGPDCAAATELRSARYEEIYDSIPFSRAEYDANPSYRHDATMEFLFGKLRPTVIQRGTTRVDVNLPETIAYPGMGYPHLYNLPYFPWYTPGGRVYRGR